MAGKQVAHAQPQEQKSEERKSTRAETTLAECGPRLPCGLRKDGALLRDFECRPMKTADERILAKLKKDNMTMGAYVSMILGHQMTTFAGMDFTKMKPAERVVHLGRCYMGDIFYAYVWLRRETMGDDLRMDVTCRCSPSLPFEWVGKLSTIEVATVEDEKDLVWTYELRRPIEARNKKVKKLSVTQPRWNAVTSTPPGSGELARLALIRGGVCGFNDEPAEIDFQDSEIDELSKIDLELLTKGFEPNWLGPSMSIEGQCPRCDQEFKRAINWEHSSFFGASSV